jgi:acyl carrier protein
METTINTELKREIKLLIMNSLNITDINPDDVQDDASLFGPDNVLGLDSIDALEIVMALQERYGVRIDDRNQSRFILESIHSIAEFVSQNRLK